jgi:ribosomal protein S17E
MDVVRRMSQEIMAKYPGMFGVDFTANKEALAKVAVIHSKMLRNRIVGKITKTMIAAVPEAEAEAEAEEVAAE